MKWFCSDLHLKHEKLMKLGNRPFSSVEEMDETIKNNFKTILKRNDILYILGDISMNKQVAREFLKEMISLNIDIHIIKGNHDTFSIGEILSLGCKTFSDIKEIKEDDISITLCHYAMLSYNKSHYNAWHLYGHYHTQFKDPIKGKRMNVNLEFNDYKPYSMEQIKDYMNNQPDNWDLIKREKKA